MKNKSTFETKKEQRKKKLATARKNQNKFMVKSLVLASAILILFFVTYQSGFFTVTKVTVEGNKQLKEGQVLKAAAAPKSSNFFNFPSAEVEDRVSTLAWVEKATVQKKFPGSIVIKIVEREPLGYISSEGVLFVIDVEGTIVSTETYKKKLPMIDGLTGEKITIGKSIRNDSLKNVVGVVTKLPAEIRNKIYSIAAPNEDELSFVIGGIEVIYGKAESIDIKNKVIQKFLNSKENDIISTVDVRVPERPVIKKIGK